VRSFLNGTALLVGRVPFLARLTCRHGRGGRSPRRGSRCAAVLALGLGLNGVGLCLCLPEPVKAHEAHGCCPHPARPDAGASVTGTSLLPAPTPCCAPLLRTDAARLAERGNERQPLSAATPSQVSRGGQVPPAAIGASPARPSRSSPPRTTVLRI
jgi:hypothetical protein